MSEMDMEEPEFKAKQLRFEYSTAALIAELEKRRPCGKCSRYSSVMVKCKSLSNCVWKRGAVMSNFKEAK